jgi:hypothetical protein
VGGGPVEITPKLTVDLLSQSLALRQELRQDYRLLPQTRCRRRSLCCSLLPEMTRFEALIAVGHPRGHGSCREDGSHEGAYPVFLDEPCGAELLSLPPRKGLPHLPGAVFRLSCVWSSSPRRGTRARRPGIGRPRRSIGGSGNVWGSPYLPRSWNFSFPIVPMWRLWVGWR